MKYKYAFALLGNARAFVESAVEYARLDRQDLWKFAVIHVTTALELLLKARLAIEDHQHLVAGKTPVSDRQFDEGNFHSIGIEECIDKLSRIIGFTLSSRQRQVLSTLRSLRNRVAHYIDPGDKMALKAAVAAGLSLFVDINHTQFQDDDPYGAGEIPQFVEELTRYKDFVSERLSSLSGHLGLAPRPRTHHADECSHCLQDATVIDGENLRCLFCGHAMEVWEFADLISHDGTVKTCPSCDRRSVSKYQRQNDSPTYECFCCGHFTGPELRWQDVNAAIPRLHADRHA